MELIDSAHCCEKNYFKERFTNIRYPQRRLNIIEGLEKEDKVYQIKIYRKDGRLVEKYFVDDIEVSKESIGYGILSHLKNKLHPKRRKDLC